MGTNGNAWISITRRGSVRPLLGVAITALGISLAPAASAESSTWKPTRPVTLVVPYSPGGGTDATARAVAKRLTTTLGQSVVVENQPGADGLIGTRRVIDAKPDGYTLLMQVPSVVVARYQPAQKGYDPLAHLTPVSAIGQSPQVVVASGKLPVKTLAELVQYCKAAKEPCSVGTGESVARLMAHEFSAEAGIDNLILVNYKGTAAIVGDLVAGNVSLALSGVAATTPMHRAGALRILAANSPRRSPDLPEVPTSAEAGMPQLQSMSWFGLFAPKGTPADLVEAIYQALREAGNDAEVQRAIKISGAELVLNTPAQFAELLRKDQAYYGALANRFPFE